MLKETIKVLYPPRPTASRRRIRRSGSSLSDGSSFHCEQDHLDRSSSYLKSYCGTPFTISKNFSQRSNKARFSELLLEYGEKHVNDWAVCASSYSFDSRDCSSFQLLKKMEGRLRLCSRSIVFEPRNFSRGILRIPFRYMMACPYLLDDSSSSFSQQNEQMKYCRLETESSTVRNDNGNQTMIFVVRSERHIIMKANNVIGPYEQIQVPMEFKFIFSHSSPASMISLVKLLYDSEEKSIKSSTVNSFPDIPMENLSNNGGSTTKSLIRSQIEIIEQATNAHYIPFDPTNFLHVKEYPLTPNLRCSIKQALLEQKGSAIVTNYGLYFQPLEGDYIAGSGSKAHVWFIGEMKAVAHRYDGMKDCGLEIYLAKKERGINITTSYHSVLLSFESTVVREQVIRLLISQRKMKKTISMELQCPLLCLTDRTLLDSALDLWLSGDIDNFEYLLFLNCAAGRSFHDLSRYPVFPWVLSCYETTSTDNVRNDGSVLLDLCNRNNFRDLSKPVGGLNNKRSDEFQKRYQSMLQQQMQQKSQPSKQLQHHSFDAPFMYGTHYSAPGYVLFYLLRAMPEHMLCLQNGKFDVPDRLFHSIADTYKSILNNPADVKELIPEFYDSDCFDFLINSLGLQLGSLQTGKRVNDVLLPSWAKSAKHFLQLNRAALESDLCTQNLPKWIDLIFGVTSRGERAKCAHNLFHPLSYLGPSDLEAIQSQAESKQVELQASEFGIVPDQLFCKEHPFKGKNHVGWKNVESVVMADHLRESYICMTNDKSNLISKKHLACVVHGSSNDESMVEDVMHEPIVNPFS